MQSDKIKTRKTIGVLSGIQVYYSTILGNYIGPVLHGLCSAAHDYDCNLLVAGGIDDYTVLSRSAWPEPAPDADFVPVGPWNTDGLVVINPLFTEAKSHYIQDIRATGKPVVFVSSGEIGPAVCVDNDAAIRQAIIHLSEHGHRSIAFIAGYPQDLTGDSTARLQAYQSAISSYGLVIDPQLIAYGYHSIDGGKAAMRQLLDSKITFTAVLASNDESAIGAMQVIQSAGLRIPQDIAIIGFDDSLEALTQTPPLTTLHYSPSEMGYMALEFLLEHIAKRQAGEETIKVPARLVTRQSCGCQPGDMLDQANAILHETSLSNRAVAMSQLVQAMTENTMREAQCLSVAEVHALCSRLVETLVSSLKSNDPAVFYQAVDDTRFHTENIEEEVHIWQVAISTLEAKLELLLVIGGSTMKLQQARNMLRNSHMTLNESTQRQFRRYIVARRWTSDRIGRLNASLLTALDRSQIFAILAEHFPDMGIQHADVAFLEPEGADPVAWSSIHAITPPRAEPHARFLSREFPPPGMYTEPFSLILLPLAKQEDDLGYVVFDTANLEIYANIVWQLSTFFKVARLYQEANEGRRQAEEAALSKSRFLSMVSHELRTPLSLILGLSELMLQKEEISATHHSDLELIRASARQLDGLFRDVVELAQDDPGQWKLNFEALDLVEVLHPVATVAEQLANKKGLTWQATIPLVLPLIWGDRVRLQQIVMNLINNAIKFTNQGQITLMASIGEDDIIVVVSDTGPGISLPEQRNIFAEFRQNRRTRAKVTNYESMGLGLIICKHLVELHGGQIGIHSSSENGQGTSMYFTIPRIKKEKPIDNEKALAHTQPLHELPPASASPVSDNTETNQPDQVTSQQVDYLWKPIGLPELTQALKRNGVNEKSEEEKQILLVDDDPNIVETYTRMLQGWSSAIKILKAQNGSEAINTIRTKQPDLVLLDLMMPELDGFKVLEIMRSEPASQKIPVIILTGQALTQESLTRISSDVDSILQKDIFSLAETSSHLKTALRREKDMSSAGQRLARKAMAYIDEQYTEPISLESVAAHFWVSKEHLARCFREETGVTLTTYLNRYRIKQAKALLRERERSVGDVAMQVGFSNASYFSRIFKQETGKSPQAYRKER